MSDEAAQQQQEPIRITIQPDHETAFKLAVFLVSGGRHGEAPPYWHTFRLAQIIGCNVKDLPEQAPEVLNMAATILQAELDGPKAAETLQRALDNRVQLYGGNVPNRGQ